MGLEEKKIDILKPLRSMYENCKELDAKVNEDGILRALFDYFIVSLIINYLEMANVEREKRPAILQELMDRCHLDIMENADEIYDDFVENENAAHMYYSIAFNEKGMNFWRMQSVSAIKAGNMEDGITFIKDSLAFILTMEVILKGELGLEKVVGTAEEMVKIIKGQFHRKA